MQPTKYVYKYLHTYIYIVECADNKITQIIKGNQIY